MQPRSGARWRQKGRAFALCAFGCAWLGAACIARAQAEPARDEGTGLVVGAKVGGGMGAPLNAFGGSFATEVELGYRLPFPQPIGRAFELFSSFAYAAPRTSGVAATSDPRLPGDGRPNYVVQEQTAAVGFGLLYRIELPAHVFAPYFAAGARIHMLRTNVKGEVAAQAFGKNEETATSVGPAFAAGIDLYLGPGALLGELQLTYASVDGFVLRNTNVGALGLFLGYRLMP